MCTINVGIGHDNDAVVAELFRFVFVFANAGTQSGNEGGNFLRTDELVETGFFYVKNFALQRQNGLELTITTLLGRTAGGVTLHQVQFAFARIFFLAVSQFTGQAHAVEHALTTRHFTCLTSRVTGTGRFYDLAGNHLGIGRTLQQEFR